MGTAAIAAQGMTNIIENLNGILALGVGVGLMTIVGETLGAGRKEEAVYYVKKLCIISEVIIIASCLSCMHLSARSRILAAWNRRAQKCASTW